MNEISYVFLICFTSILALVIFMASNLAQLHNLEKKPIKPNETKI